MYTAETLPKGKNRVMGTIQIMTGFLHIGFGIVLTTLTNLYTSVFVIGEIPFLGGVSFIISGCLSIGAEKSPTECAVKGSQTMNVISAIFALLGIVAFIVDLNLNVLYHSSLDYHGNGISIVLLIFTILEFCIAVATANFWCRATRLSSNESMLIVPSANRVDLAVPPAELPQPPSYTETIHIFTGIIHILFGIILTVSEHENPSLPVASGILFWLGILLLVSGSLLVESEKRDNIVLVRTCCVVNVGVALGALVATVVHGAAITRLLPGCERRVPLQIPPEWCLNANGKILSNGLDSTFVLLNLLEFCVAVAALAFGYEAVRQHSYTHMDKALRTSWARKMKERQEKKLVRDLARQLEEGKWREREIRNPLKLKRAKKKQLRRVEKRDTLALLQKTPVRRSTATE
ncbi:hypothetical protein BTVI_33120 [Pitangus sulphuratus]|nr:hypothetical protein BTVI_33120 [Pitangus sulphuratus]